MERRGKAIACWVSEKFYEIVKREAEKRGVTISDFIKYCIMKVLDAEREEEDDEKKEWWRYKSITK